MSEYSLCVLMQLYQLVYIWGEPRKLSELMFESLFMLYIYNIYISFEMLDWKALEDFDDM